MELKPVFSNRAAIIVVIITALSFGFLFIVLGIVQRRSALAESKNRAWIASEKLSIETQNYLSRAFHVTRAFANSFKVLHKNKVDRQILRKTMYEYFKNDTNFLAVWLMWEPGMYDNKDAKFKNLIGYDQNGNVNFTYFRFHGKIVEEIGDTSFYSETYYTDPKKARREMIIDPYLYKYEGFDTIYFETSIVTPIIQDSTFLGVWAVDLDLRRLQDMHRLEKLYKTGFISLISGNGTIISHPDSNFINKNIDSILNWGSESWQLLHNGHNSSFITRSEFTNEEIFRIIRPISIGSTHVNWYLLIDIPMNEIEASSDFLLILAYFILIMGLCLMIYLIVNIRERRKYEKALLKAKEKAEESDELKSAFLRNISHEFRTPMNGILGFADLLTQPDVPMDRMEEYKQIMMRSCNQLIHTLDDVIDVSLIQANQTRIKLAPIHLKSLITNLVESFKEIVVKSHIDLILEYQVPGQLEYINSDEEKLTQILHKLIHNALKFTQKGHVLLHVEWNGNALLFTISDTGVGIQKKEKEYIFDLFRQAETDLSKIKGGLGIGLPIARAFVAALGGKLSMESEYGKGSVFYFSLPLVSVDLEKVPADDVKDEGLQILIAEDEDVNYIYLQEILGNSGFKLCRANNGEEAIEMVLKNRIDLILMDLKMPVLNGYDAALKIKELKPNIPVIAYTAYTLNYDMMRMAPSIFDDFLTKPVLKTNVLAVIYRCLEQKSKDDQTVS